MINCIVTFTLLFLRYNTFHLLVLTSYTRQFGFDVRYLRQITQCSIIFSVQRFFQFHSSFHKFNISLCSIFCYPVCIKFMKFMFQQMVSEEYGHLCEDVMTYSAFYSSKCRICSVNYWSDKRQDPGHGSSSNKPLQQHLSSVLSEVLNIEPKWQLPEYRNVVRPPWYLKDSSDF